VNLNPGDWPMSLEYKVKDTQESLSVSDWLYTHVQMQTLYDFVAQPDKITQCLG